MKGNEIGDKGTEALSEVLEVYTTLKSLFLWSEDKQKRGERKR